MKKVIFAMVSLIGALAFADTPTTISAKCMAGGAKMALAAALDSAQPEGLISVGFDLSNGNQIYVEGDDILVPIQIVSAQNTVSMWYMVPIEDPSACTLGTPALYDN